LLQQLLVIVAVAREGLFIFRFLKRIVEAALSQQPFGIYDQLGAVPITSQQLVPLDKHLSMASSCVQLKSAGSKETVWKMTQHSKDEGVACRNRWPSEGRIPMDSFSRI